MMLSLERALPIKSSSSDPTGNSTHTASKGKSREAQRFLQDLLWDYLFEFFAGEPEEANVKLNENIYLCGIVLSKF